MQERDERLAAQHPPSTIDPEAIQVAFTWMCVLCGFSV